MHICNYEKVMHNFMRYLLCSINVIWCTKNLRESSFQTGYRSVGDGATLDIVSIDEIPRWPKQNTSPWYIHQECHFYGSWTLANKKMSTFRNSTVLRGMSSSTQFRTLIIHILPNWNLAKFLERGFHLKKNRRMFLFIRILLYWFYSDEKKTDFSNWYHKLYTSELPGNNSGYSSPCYIYQKF